MPMYDAPPTPKRPPPDPLGVDYGDGQLIPPLPDNPYAAPPVPGANAGGGPGQPMPEGPSGLLAGLFGASQQPAMPAMPPGMMPPPLNAPVEPPRYLQAQPNPMPGPMPQGPGPHAPIRRFPRATSLIPSAAPPMNRGY
jgi:hypothetical protein